MSIFVTLYIKTTKEVFICHIEKKYSKEFTSSTNINKLMSLIPEKLLNTLISKYKSDYRIRLLFTIKFLRLNIFARLLKSSNLTLRGMVEYSKNYLIKFICGFNKNLSRSGLSDRQNNIPSGLFLELLLHLVKFSGRLSKKLMEEASNVKIFDTTFIALSLKIFNWLPKCNQTNKGVLKIGLRIDDSQTIPEHIVIDYESTNDNTIFEQLLNFAIKGVTYLFDRGFYKIKVLVDIHLSGNFFITRMYPSYIVNVVENLIFSKTKNINDFIRVIKDQLVYIGSGENKSPILFRLITAINIQTKEKLLFLTNRLDLEPIEVCQLYKHRWQIEILFRWLKQYLKINKLIARSLNGVLVQIYITMIVHVLLLLYRQLHRLNISALQILRNIENHIINFFAQSMFYLGTKTRWRLKLKGSNFHMEEVLC